MCQVSPALPKAAAVSLPSQIYGEQGLELKKTGTGAGEKGEKLDFGLKYRTPRNDVDGEDGRVRSIKRARQIGSGRVNK